MQAAAVFLDRDGTIIEDVDYLNHPKDIKFFPGAVAAIKQLNEAGYKVIIISNQAGIARGLLTEDLLQTIDKTIHKQVLSGGGHVDGSYYCPHHPDHGVYPYKQICECRKPHPGLLKKAQKDLNLDLSKSFMVGDKATDIEAGQRAGVTTIFVQTGRDKQAPADFTANDLPAAVGWILKKAGK